MTTPRVRRQYSSALRLFLVLALGSLSYFPVEARAKQHDSDSKKSHEKPYGLIFGTVWGPDDRPVFGVKVSVRRARDKKARWELASDHNGEFAVRVPAGREDYVVWVDQKGVKSLPGKQLHPVQDVKVHIENDERSDIGLHLK